MSATIINLITPIAGAKHELLFNKPASEPFHSVSVPCFSALIVQQGDCLPLTLMLQPDWSVRVSCRTNQDDIDQ